MTGNIEKSEKDGGRKWAPWYVYAVLIIGGNYIKQSLLEDAPVFINVIATAIVAGVIFLLVTAVYRSIFARGRRSL
ncbi:putative RND superfamily exporter protein [Nonomuraea thailandensis]|uniref:RND superfamily exporter protein n=1 Tax=Nonomuraea thailandensis TaxID=1188745 RepID=A0A9X2K1H7_9ACTN|nr:hypothetical protein [Nonomuraea thailandensis]MCP2353546.1 putative RND superfamily exporter protein [Nonomuraea thailandensis]